MSLIGSLEDLNLEDILQIIYLSQKSGLLGIRTEGGQGRIVFRDGLVCGAHVVGGATDLRGLLVGGGFVEEDSFDRIAEECDSERGDLEAELAKQELITPERIESLRREGVESAVASMFSWESGEFSFDVQRESDAEDSRMLLAKGINPQFLAMERVRIEDESSRGADYEPELEDDPNEMSAEEMFGVVEDPEEEAPLEAEMLAEEKASPLHEPERGDFPHEGELLDADLVESAERESAGAARPFQPTSEGPIVAIDADLEALEWTKRALKDGGRAIHIFQRTDLGLTRIRQYLARGVVPLVLLSPGIPGDPASGIPDASDFAKRLQVQASSIQVVWLCEAGGVEPQPAHPISDRVLRPGTLLFRNRAAARQLEDLACSLRDDLARITGADSVGGSKPEAPSDRSAAGGSETTSASDRSLGITRELSDASTRGEILPMVIRFARESFERVAMFMVRGDRVMGIAQSGLETCGGPDDHGMRGLTLDGLGSSWFRSVLSSKKPCTSAPEDAGDFQLAAHLGDRAAAEAYLAPILSGDEIVAVLYADNLPGNAEIADTELVEVALRQAGLALERALLERTQAE